MQDNRISIRQNLVARVVQPIIEFIDGQISRSSGESDRLALVTLRQENDSVLAADLPAFLFLVEALCELVAIGAEADNDIALDSTHTADPWSTSGGGHWANSDLEVG